MSTADQLNAIAADLRVQAANLEAIASGGAPTQPPNTGGGSPVIPPWDGQPLVQHSRVPCTAADQAFQFIAAANTNFSAGPTPALPPGLPSGALVTLSIEDMAGNPIVAPGPQSNYATISATALTPGDKYQIRVQLTAGSVYLQYN